LVSEKVYTHAMNPSNTKERIKAVYHLLTQETTTHEKLDHIKTLIHGINPRLDTKLDSLSQLFSDYEKLHNGDVIELNAEHLPEETEEEKKRKKALLLLIKSWKELRNEVERVKTELEHKNTQQGQVKSFGKIIAGAKGPFGVITIVALVIAGGIFYYNSHQKNQVTPQVAGSTTNRSIQGIIAEGKKIPLSEIYIGHGTDCDSPHFHAKNHMTARALDGTIVSDPGGCGFGKAKDVAVVDIQ